MYKKCDVPTIKLFILYAWYVPLKSEFIYNVWKLEKYPLRN